MAGADFSHQNVLPSGNDYRGGVNTISSLFAGYIVDVQAAEEQSQIIDTSTVVYSNDVDQEEDSCTAACVSIKVNNLTP